MRTSSRFTIAVHILLAIGYFDGKEKTTSDFIAQSVGVNPVIIRRTLGQLKTAGLVTVEAGVGGASLARDPHEVTLLDVFDAVEADEGNALFGFHGHPNLDCPVGKSIHTILDPKIGDAQDALRESLRETTLDELLSDLNEHLPHES